MTNVIPDAALDDRWAIVGTSGAGKSYTARGMQERLIRSGATVCWVDALGIAYGIRSSADGAGAGFPVIIFGGRHADVEITENMGKAVGEIIAAADYSTIVDLDGLGSGAARRRFMLAFLEALYEAKRRQGTGAEPLHVIFDEADLWAPQRPGPDALALLGKMEEIVRRGRVAGFIPWLITQRPAVLHKDVLSQADGLIAMKLTSSQDRNALGAWIEGQADAAQAKAILADLPKLPQGTGYVWSPARGLLDRVAFPKITTFDSSRTPRRGERVAKVTTLAEVDVAGIRAALAEAVEPPTPKGKKALSISAPTNEAAKVDIDALQKAAWADGRATGRIEGDAEGYQRGLVYSRMALDSLAGRPTDKLFVVFGDSAKRPADEIINSGQHSTPSAAASHRPERQAPPSPARRTAGSAGPAASPLLAAAVRHWPARLAWGQLAALSKRKARGGHFNTERKRLIDGGLVVEEGDAVIPTDAGFAAGGGKPERPQSLAEAYLAALPDPAGRMLAVILKLKKLTTHRLGAELGIQPRGGHWNTGLSNLRRCGLITVSGDRIELQEAALGS